MKKISITLIVLIAILGIFLTGCNTNNTPYSNENKNNEINQMIDQIKTTYSNVEELCVIFENMSLEINSCNYAKKAEYVGFDNNNYEGFKKGSQEVLNGCTKILQKDNNYYLTAEQLNQAINEDNLFFENYYTNGLLVVENSLKEGIKSINETYVNCIHEIILNLGENILIENLSNMIIPFDDLPSAYKQKDDWDNYLIQRNIPEIFVITEDYQICDTSGCGPGWNDELTEIERDILRKKMKYESQINELTSGISINTGSHIIYTNAEEIRGETIKKSSTRGGEIDFIVILFPDIDLTKDIYQQIINSKKTANNKRLESYKEYGDESFGYFTNHPYVGNTNRIIFRENNVIVFLESTPSQYGSSGTLQDIEKYSEIIMEKLIENN